MLEPKRHAYSNEDVRFRRAFIRERLAQLKAETEALKAERETLNGRRDAEAAANQAAAV